MMVAKLVMGLPLRAPNTVAWSAGRGGDEALIRSLTPGGDEALIRWLTPPSRTRRFVKSFLAGTMGFAWPVFALVVLAVATLAAPPPSKYASAPRAPMPDA